MASDAESELLFLELPEQVKPEVRVERKSVFPIIITKKFTDNIYDLEVRDSDIFVITWPKSGTTWMQHLVDQIVHGMKANEEKHLLNKFMFIEFPIDFSDKNSEGQYTLAEKAPTPRLFKSHLVPRFLPRQFQEKKPKIIIVSRNPKDAVVSFYHFCLTNALLPTYNSWNEVFDQFCKGLLPHGDWFEHTLYWWKKREEPNVLFIKYEHMKQDLRAAVIRVGEFLGKSLTDDVIDDICKNSTLNKMKNNTKVNPDFGLGIGKEWRKAEGTFIRKGEIGDWKNHFTDSQSKKYDEMYKKETEGTGLSFRYE